MQIAGTLATGWLLTTTKLSGATPDVPPAGANDDPNRLIVVGQIDEAKLVPIAIKGYIGEVAEVIKFDLEVQGFKIVPEKEARYILQGRNQGMVEGALQDANRAVLFNKAYQGGAARLQAHTLSDDVVQAALSIAGIGRTKILFRQVTSQTEREIYVSDYDGDNAVALTSDKRLCAAPAWGANNRKVYYTSYLVRNGIEAPTLMSHDLDNGQREVISRFSGINTGAAVGRNGWLAMVLSRGQSIDLYVASPSWTSRADPEAKQLLRITQSREEVSSPSWSPDSRWICFATRIDGRSMLVRAPSGGGPLTRIPTIGISRPTEPAWSPDGRWIAFTASGGGFKICVVPAEGGEANILAHGEDPSWAPNSRTLIFTRRVTHQGVNKRSLALLDVPTKQVKLIPAFTGSVSQAAWAW